MNLVELYELGREYHERDFSEDTGKLQQLTAKQLGQAMVLVTSAFNLLDHIYNHADEYDPESGTWESAAALEAQKQYLDSALTWLNLELVRRLE